MIVEDKVEETFIDTLTNLYNQMLEERLEAWRGYEPRRDDMTFLAFRLK